MIPSTLFFGPFFNQKAVAAFWRYIFSGATTPMSVKALCITISIACVSVKRASTSPSESAFITGSAL
jgi:hypothetical protein